MNLQERIAPIDRQLVENLIESIPISWDVAELLAERKKDDGVEKLAITISNPRRPADPVSSNDEIHGLLFQLMRCFDGEAMCWTKVIYRIKKFGQDDWRYTVSFTY